MPDQSWIEKTKAEIAGKTGEVRVDCQCGGGQNQTVAVNASTGAYICHRCGLKGNILRANTQKAAPKAKASAMDRARWIWEHAEPVKAHSYLDKKKIKSHGLKVYKNSLVIPFRKISRSEIQTLQFIKPDGQKILLKDGQKTGSAFILGNISENSTAAYLCEGYATACSIFEAMQHPVVVCIDASNLKPVSASIRKQYPDIQIVICADNDRSRPKSEKSFDIGYRKAVQAAHASGGKVCMPEKPGYDFNDLIVSSGPEAVKAVISKAVMPESGEIDQGGPGLNEPEIDKPVIKIIPGNLSLMTDAAEATLIRLGESMYQFGSLLVRPIMAEAGKKGGIFRKDAGMTVLHPVDCPFLRDRISRVISWEKFNKRQEAWQAADPPRDVAETMLSRLGMWNFKKLQGISHTPTLRNDGSMLDTPGYDHKSGILYTPNAFFPKISKSPAPEEASKALATLQDALKTFPFEDKADESVAIAAMLTVIIRPSLKTSPFFLVNSPVAGSGKSKLVDGIAVLSTGKPAAVISIGDREEETEKRLHSALLQGDQILCLDNIERRLQGQAICQILTQQYLKIRPLGQSKMVDILSKATLFGTGNNVILSGDMPRRSLICRINPLCEKPEERHFEQDFIDTIQTHRGALVHSALTILKAYHNAGMPDQNIRPMGSFENWSYWIRSPLVWLGLADPLATKEFIQDSDPLLSSLKALFESWHAEFKGSPSTVKKAIADAIDKKDYGDPALFDAMESIAGDKNGINARRLGNFMARNKDRIIGGYQLIKDGTRQRLAAWDVKRLDQKQEGNNEPVSVHEDSGNISKVKDSSTQYDEPLPVGYAGKDRIDI